MRILKGETKKRFHWLRLRRKRRWPKLPTERLALAYYLHNYNNNGKKYYVNET